MLSLFSAVYSERCGRLGGICSNSGCSEFLWCGVGNAYSSGNCLVEYSAPNSCSPLENSNPPPLLVSKDGSCGLSTNNNNIICPAGTCCSIWGFCGDEDLWCLNSASLPNSTISLDGKCGINSDGINVTCPATSCCSSWGYCGFGSPWCDHAATHNMTQSNHTATTF